MICNLLGVSRRLLKLWPMKSRKINRLRGEPLNGRGRRADVQYNGMSHRSSYKHMQCIKHGAAADVCTSALDFSEFHCHHYALVHIPPFVYRSTCAQMGTVC